MQNLSILGSPALVGSGKALGNNFSTLIGLQSYRHLYMCIIPPESTKEQLCTAIFMCGLAGAEHYKHKRLFMARHTWNAAAGFSQLWSKVVSACRSRLLLPANLLGLEFI